MNPPGSRVATGFAVGCKTILAVGGAGFGEAGAVGGGRLAAEGCVGDGGSVAVGSDVGDGAWVAESGEVGKGGPPIADGNVAEGSRVDVAKLGEAGGRVEVIIRTSGVCVAGGGVAVITITS